MLGSVHHYKAELATALATATTYLASDIDGITNLSPTIGLALSFLICKGTLSLHIKAQKKSYKEDKNDYMNQVKEVAGIAEKLIATKSEHNEEIIRSIITPAAHVLEKEAANLANKHMKIQELINSSDKMADDMKSRNE